MDLQHSRACCQCGHVSNGDESNVMLSLNVPGEGGAASGAPLSLASLLSTYFSEEEVDKDCDNCGARLASHTARRRVVRMPRPVQAPETLSLSAFALDEVAPAGYRLTAIVRHIGANYV